MNPETIAAIILGTAGALILGMAALIKAMVIGKLDAIQETLTEMTQEIHQIDIRVTRLEAEHRINCPHR